MEAAVCHAFGEPLVVEDVSLASPGAGEVRVRVAACAICHSGVDCALVAAGATSAVDLALRLVRRGGTVVLVGMPESGATVALDPGALAHDGIRILGSKLGSALPAVDVPALAALYLEGRLRLDELVSSRSPLSAINEALGSAARGEALRAVIVP